ncbi:ATP-binding protein [Streptomyces sp. NPDC096080]|uniref:ATP-binding protein n=1 Tax=Streptomyces sp. NPDC096080 TaxID=3156693 RepID=UPI00331DD33B
MAASSFPTPGSPTTAGQQSTASFPGARPVALAGDHASAPSGPGHPFDLPAVPASVATVRNAAGDLMRNEDVDRGAWDDVLLVVSELATNALQHCSGERIAGRLALSGDVLRCEVEEHGVGLGLPEARRAEHEDENGRGLFLVDALSLAWGVSPILHGEGQIVWAELRAPRLRRGGHAHW